MTRGQRHVADRTAGEPAADLTEHRVVHRAMRLDLARLASAAAKMSTLGQECPPGRRVAFRDYLRALVAVIDTHLRVDSDTVAALLPAVAVAPTTGADDRRNVAQLLELATAIADRQADPEAGCPSMDPDGGWLATTLRHAGLIVVAYTTQQERDVFPLIRRHLRAEDYAWVQADFRTELPPGVLAFFAPWTVRHATSSDLPTLLDSDLGVPARIFRHRFDALRAHVYGIDVHAEPGPGRPTG